MKNRIQFFAMAACCAAVMLFSGCEKEHAHVITATIEDAGHPAKVHLVDGLDDLHYPHFVENDTIIVNGQKYLSEGTGQTCKFLAYEDDAEGPYYAVYPASALAATCTTYNQPSIVLPAKQVYSEESGVQRLDAPMCGANTQDNIKFHNLCSVMKVDVKNPADATIPITVSSIEITSPSYKLNYPSGLQISKAMNASDDTQREWLNAQTSSTENDPLRTVTLTNTSVAGSIAAGESKPFYIYLPTFKPTGSDPRVALTVKVTTLEGSCMASYSRTARLDSLKRNIINDYNFLVNPAIRQVEKYFINVGTPDAPQYVDFTKHNENVTNQLSLGNCTSSTYTSDRVLTPDQWNNLFANSASNNGLALINGTTLGFVILPDNFVYPEGCASLATSGREYKTDKNGNTCTWTIAGTPSAPTSGMVVYTSGQWNAMEAAGAVLIPMDFVTTNTEKKTGYYVQGYSKGCNMFFTTKFELKGDGSYKNGSVVATVNYNKDNNYPVYTEVRTKKNMN